MIDQQTKAVEDAQLILITPDAADPKGYLGTSEAVEGAVTDAGATLPFSLTRRERITSRRNVTENMIRRW